VTAVRAKAASNKMTPRDALLALASDRTPLDRLKTALNRASSPEALRLPAGDRDHRARRAAAGSPALPEELREALSREFGEGARMRAARSPRAGCEALFRAASLPALLRVLGAGEEALRGALALFARFGGLEARVQAAALPGDAAGGARHFGGRRGGGGFSGGGREPKHTEKVPPPPGPGGKCFRGHCHCPQPLRHP
jgi:hypothetical protein